jgi:glyoxylase-like metal-dependent hydrolase (beta-lactamase superfamily II)
MTRVEVHEIDLMHGGVPGAISTWLVSGAQGHVLIESGPASTLPALTDGLASHGVALDDLSAVLLTHIHLDHAGAAWALAKRGVAVHVHTIGVPHLLDPKRLNQSSRRIFGERFEDLWGALEACPAGTVHGAADGDEVTAGGLSFRAFETRGHANHHHAWHLLELDGAHLFVGDAAAMRLPGTRWITIPMPPPELDVQAWLDSLDTLASGPWSKMHLTHCGVVDDIDAHLKQLRQAMQEQVQWIRTSMGQAADARRHTRSQMPFLTSMSVVACWT